MNSTIDSTISRMRYLACVRKIIYFTGLLFFLFSFNSVCFARRSARTDDMLFSEYDEPSFQGFFNNQKSGESDKSNWISLVGIVFMFGFIIVCAGIFFGMIKIIHLIFYIVLGLIIFGLWKYI